MSLLELQEWLSQGLGIGVAAPERTVGQVVLRGILVFAAGIALVRMAAKRLLGSHTPFDFILAVILGSMLARAINGGAPLVPTIAAAGALVLLDRTIALGTTVSDRLRRGVEGSPVQVIRDGRILNDRLRRHQLGPGHVRAALRRAGLTDPEDAAEAYIETNGMITVVPRWDGPGGGGEPSGRKGT